MNEPRMSKLLLTHFCPRHGPKAVAQSCTLLYRRFAIGRASKHSSALELPTVRRMQFCDTAECNSALRGREMFGFERMPAVLILTFACFLLHETLRDAHAATERFSVAEPGWVNSIAFSPDSKTLAIACADKRTRLRNAATGEALATLAGHNDYVASVAFAGDGKTLATGSYDHTAQLWNIDSKQRLAALTGHRGVVMSVAFSPDAALLATASIDTTVKIWNTSSGKLRATLSGHKPWVNAVVFNPDGGTLISGSSDGTVKIWDANAMELKATLQAADA
jgi:predicted NACHT family NTPase